MINPRRSTQLAPRPGGTCRASCVSSPSGKKGRSATIMGIQELVKQVCIERHANMRSTVHGQAWNRRERGSESRTSMVRGRRRAGGMRGGDSCGQGGMGTCERAKTDQQASVRRRKGCRAGYTWSTLVRIGSPTPHRCSCARARSPFAPALRPARAGRRSRALDAHVLASLPT